MLVLANLVGLFHGVVIVPILLIAPLVFIFSTKRYRWLEEAFMIVAILGTILFLVTGGCILTTWEQDLRVAAGGPSYTEGFTSHYLMAIGIDWPDIASTVLFDIFTTLGILKVMQLWWLDRKLAHRKK